MAGYGSFAVSGHPVLNTLRWDKNKTVGLPKQRNSYQSARLSFALKVPLRYLRPSIIYSSPCDRILQTACSWTERTSKFMNRQKGEDQYPPILDLAYGRKNKLLLRDMTGSPERVKYICSELAI